MLTHAAQPATLRDLTLEWTLLNRRVLTALAAFRRMRSLRVASVFFVSNLDPALVFSAARGPGPQADVVRTDAIGSNKDQTGHLGEAWTRGAAHRVAPGGILDIVVPCRPCAGPPVPPTALRLLQVRFRKGTSAMWITRALDGVTAQLVAIHLSACTNPSTACLTAGLRRARLGACLYVGCPRGCRQAFLLRNMATALAGVALDGQLAHLGVDLGLKYGVSGDERKALAAVLVQCNRLSNRSWWRGGGNPFVLVDASVPQEWATVKLTVWT